MENAGSLTSDRPKSESQSKLGRLSDPHCDLLIITDATASMGSYLTALRTSIPEILALSRLAGVFRRLGVLAYRDYSDPRVIEWSGWAGGDSSAREERSTGVVPANVISPSTVDLQAFVEKLTPFGGGDYPEAAKTALLHAIDLVGSYEKQPSDAAQVQQGQTLVLWYADAPPHHASLQTRIPTATGSTIIYTQDKKKSPTNAELEKRAFTSHTQGTKSGTLQKSGPASANGAWDWVQLTHRAREAGMTVFAFTPNLSQEDASFYVYLAQSTRGICVSQAPEARTPARIARVTVDVVLRWTRVGVEKSVTGMGKNEYDGVFMRKFDVDPLTLGKSEQPMDENEGSRGYLPSIAVSSSDSTPTLGKKLVNFRFRTGQVSPPESSTTPSVPHHKNASLARRFSDPKATEYRALVWSALSEIVETNVSALTRNPIFGQLWRAVCREPPSNAQQKLVRAFSDAVGKLGDGDGEEHAKEEKQAMRRWLEDSFDASEEIAAMVQQLDERGGGEGPVVYLDLDVKVDLTRTELLEVSRSCYSGVLKRLVEVFTHLKVKHPGSETVLPASHRTLPLALPPRAFFRALPHLVVRGTLYPSRGASISALVALVTGNATLRSKSLELLTDESVRENWLDLEIPENLSFESAKLLLRADDAARRSISFSEPFVAHSDAQERGRAGEEWVVVDSTPEAGGESGGILTQRERRTYSDLCRYRFLELNLDAPVNVELPWTPEKTRGVGDRFVKCQQCNFSRSVTLMSDIRVGICGLCLTDVDVPEHGEDQSCWVECGEKTCRAQYVVERAEVLRDKPKCHYCRHNMRCPWLECIRCTNRVIIPRHYRQQTDKEAFVCPACTNLGSETSSYGVKVFAPHETTMRILNSENGVAWLGYADPLALNYMFKRRTPFKLFQYHDFHVFEVDEFLLDSDEAKMETKMVLGGKQVRDPAGVRAWLEERVKHEVVELGSCALCFEERPHEALMPACGRSGCVHRVDEACLRAWYASCEPGKLVNLMQLACPFCRRKPDLKVLIKYNPDALGLGGLADALQDRRFFYAWCIRCDFAKPAQERACCGEEWTPDVQNFVCAECRPKAPPKTAKRIKVKMINYRECPQCGVAVEKIGGCNHISCVCGAHFCWKCGHGFAWNKIYKHISICGRGYYFGTRLEDDDDEQNVEETGG